MRRRKREQTITLFSFQDIITGVAGVMLFVLLLLVVQLTLRSAVAIENAPPPETKDALPAAKSPAAENDFAQLQQDLESMRRELQQLRQQNAALMSATTRDIDAELRQAQDAINELIRVGDEIKDQANQIETDIASQEISPQRKSILQRKAELEQQLSKLGDEAQRHARGKLVAFKTSENQAAPMWVVDLRDQQATLFDVQVPGDVTRVDYQRQLPPSSVASRITKRLREQSKTRNIILLLRPSVAGQGIEYMDAFRGSGFRVALELLDEDTMVAQPSQPATNEASETNARGESP